MCTITVKIELPNISTNDIKVIPGFFQKDNKIVIDEAFLTRADDDDSFFAFELISLQD